MTSKVKVDFKQAVDFMREGFNIECYVVLEPKPVRNLSKRRVGQRIPSVNNAQYVTLSLDGLEPRNGKIGMAWPKVKAELWGKDITALYTAGYVRKELVKQGSDITAFSYLLHRCHCIRAVDDE